MKAIVCGRFDYKSPWKGKFEDIVPAYENMQSIVSLLRKAGFRKDDIIQLRDPTEEKIEQAIKELRKSTTRRSLDGNWEEAFIVFYFAGHSVVN